VKVNAKQLDKSRLGRLLVSRGYIGEEQLQQALAEQRATGDRLGEILITAGWISERDLQRTLKHQSRYRYAAAFAAIAFAPLQPMVAFAAAAPGTPTMTPPASSQQARGGLQSLSEQELARVAGQGAAGHSGRNIEAVFNNMEADELKTDSLKVLEQVATTFVPVLNFLESDVTVTGVHFGEGGRESGVNADGSVSLAMPERIERISMENIRVQGNSRSASMGDITMTDIRFHPESTLTIRAR